MKKQDLLEYINGDLLDKLFGFCYARTRDSYEAEELCSDILYALLKAAHTSGEIESVSPFIWKVAHNVYADFSNDRRKHSESLYRGDSEAVLLSLAEEDDSTIDRDELLSSVYHRIAFLTQAYREVMILFYLDGLSTAEIAKKTGTSENAIRQRLFFARQTIKKEVEEMTEAYPKPIALNRINYVIWGTGNPVWGDPRSVCTRIFSKHILWLCRKKPMSASEIAKSLNVPTLYVEEELEILCNGENGQYGLLRRMDKKKYAINFILLDRDTMEKANTLYTRQLPKVCDIIADFFQTHQSEYLSFPYLNHKVDLNLILWQQISVIAEVFASRVAQILAEKHFSDVPAVDRPFSVFGYVDHGKYYGGGRDGIDAQNICGFSRVYAENIYTARIPFHFHCRHNISQDPQLQLAIRAIEGLKIASLSEAEKECAAKAIECGYLYRDGDMLYTKILVSRIADQDKLFAISNSLQGTCFDDDAEIVAETIAGLIKSTIPQYLHSEWRFANCLANLPTLDGVVECLIQRGVLTPPENGLGAEGCWMMVER